MTSRTHVLRQIAAQLDTESLTDDGDVVRAAANEIDKADALKRVLTDALDLAAEFLGNDPKNNPGDGTLSCVRSALALSRAK